MGGLGKKLGGKKGCMLEEPGNKLLLMASVVQLMKLVLPDNVKVAETAEQLIHHYAVEFVGGKAADLIRLEHHRTVIPEDFSWTFAPVKVTDEELELLRSVTGPPPPAGGY